MLDETTDVSVSEQLTLNCRFLDESGNLCVRFLKLIEPLEASMDGEATVSLNAETISRHVKAYFEENELNFETLCGIGTDGAAVMTGKHNGVVKRLQELARSAVGLHCCGHRLQLASSQAANAVVYVKKFGTILRQLYDFFDNSSVRTAGLHAVQSALHEKILKPVEPSSTRWLSIEHSVSRLRESFISLLVSLEREGEERGDAKALGLFHLSRTYRFIATMLLMCDILPLVSKLSKAFQARQFEYSSIEPLVKSTIMTIESVKTTTGEHLQQLPQLLDRLKAANIDVKERSDDKAYFEQHIRTKYIDTLIQNISNRFRTEDVNIISQFSVFDPELLDSADATYGNDSITSLYQHFLHKPTAPDATATIMNEWTHFKKYAQESLLKQPELKSNAVVDYLCKTRLTREVFPNIVQLAMIYRTLPCHTADSERTFSQLKLIKTVHRNRLSQASLDGLVRIVIDGPSVDKFDYESTVKRWAQKKHRRIRITV